MLSMHHTFVLEWRKHVKHVQNKQPVQGPQHMVAYTHTLRITEQQNPPPPVGALTR